MSTIPRKIRSLSGILRARRIAPTVIAAGKARQAPPRRTISARPRGPRSAPAPPAPPSGVQSSSRNWIDEPTIVSSSGRSINRQAGRVAQSLLDHTIPRRSNAAHCASRSRQLRAQDRCAQIVHPARDIGGLVFDLLEHLGGRRRADAAHTAYRTPDRITARAVDLRVIGDQKPALAGIHVLVGLARIAADQRRRAPTARRSTRPPSCGRNPRSR